MLIFINVIIELFFIAAILDASIIFIIVSTKIFIIYILVILHYDHKLYYQAIILLSLLQLLVFL